jgi:hypothetical protein
MTMLHPPEFQARYGLGAQLYDARGRELRNVLSCDLETGEVVMIDRRQSPAAQLYRLFARPRPYWKWVFPRSIPTRHGFRPAPLRVVPATPQP